MHRETFAIDTRQLNIKIMDLRITSKADSAIMEKYTMKTGGSTQTGTVWDNIMSTVDDIPNTKVPATFGNWV